jgi:hypothetical protein
MSFLCSRRVLVGRQKIASAKLQHPKGESVSSGSVKRGSQKMRHSAGEVSSGAAKM